MSNFYDQARTRADYPAWREAFEILVGGMESGVISPQEFILGVERDFLDIFLQSRVPTSALQDFSRRLKRQNKNNQEVSTDYSILHEVSRRKKHPFYHTSVQLGKIIRREKFSWVSDLFLGMVKFTDYICLSKQACQDLGVPLFTTYGLYIVYKKLNPEWNIKLHIKYANFEEIYRVYELFDERGLGYLDIKLFSDINFSREKLILITNDYSKLKNSLSLLNVNQKRSQFLRSIQFECQDSPLIDWLPQLAQEAGIGLYQPNNGHWWLAPLGTPPPNIN